MILHPVLARIPRGLRGKKGVEAGRQLGRAALEYSTRQAKRPEELSRGTDPYPRDEERAPLPSHPARPGEPTWHWSTTNTTGLAAAIVAPCRVGIDAEWLDRPRIEAALEYFDAAERERLGLDERRGVLALWSAKEALLKLTGDGMSGMGRARLVDVLAPDRLRLALDGSEHEVALLFEGEHVLALAADAPGFTLDVAVLEGAGA